MFLNPWLKLLVLLLIIGNIIRAVRGFYDTKRSARYDNIDVAVTLGLTVSFVLMMSPYLLVDAFGMITGLILQVLQIGDDHLLA